MAATHMGFWTPNIGTAGRIVRLLVGIGLLTAAYFLHRESLEWWPWITGAAGVFTVTEGLRGWCVLRACKIKTPL